MTKEELFFKENYPEYVTEKGEYLSPYWDLFSAGVICATFELNNEIAELKAYNEKLLDGDIEKHNKIVELKADNKALREKVHWWKKEVNVAHRARADEFEKLVIENKVLKRKLTYAKTIIQDLLDNTDEYARQKAEDFLKESE